MTSEGSMLLYFRNFSKSGSHRFFQIRLLFSFVLADKPDIPHYFPGKKSDLFLEMPASNRRFYENSVLKKNGIFGILYSSYYYPKERRSYLCALLPKNPFVLPKKRCFGKTSLCSLSERWGGISCSISSTVFC